MKGSGVWKLTRIHTIIVLSLTWEYHVGYTFPAHSHLSPKISVCLTVSFSLHFSPWLITTPSQVDIHLPDLSTKSRRWGQKCSHATAIFRWMFIWDSHFSANQFISWGQTASIKPKLFLKGHSLCFLYFFNEFSKILNWALSLKFHIKTKTTY